jgi:hypothetical protein
MTDRIAALRETAAAERERLSETFDSLEAELKDLTDWRAMVRRDPATAVTIALGAGLVVGLAAGGTRSTRRGSGSRGEPRGAFSSLLGEIGREAWRESKMIALPLIAGKIAAMLDGGRTKRDSSR